MLFNGLLYLSALWTSGYILRCVCNSLPCFPFSFVAIAGTLNPADALSRNFGEAPSGRIVELPSPDVGLPLLRETYCPVLREEERPAWMR